MKTKLLVLCLLAVGFMAMSVMDARAGDKKRRGTAGSEQLLIPVTARTASLGTGFASGVVNAGGLEGLFANPATLTLNGGTNAMFSRMQYVADIDVNFVGFAQRIGTNQVAFTISSWNFGDIPLQTELAPEVSDVTWTAGYTTVAGSYAREFTDRISAGVTIKLVNERIDDMSSNGLAFDAGMTYIVGESGLRFGVSLNNFGPARKFGGTGLNRNAILPNADYTLMIEGADYELPSLLNFGVAYTREVAESAVITLMSNFRSNSFANDQYSLGAELGLKNIVFLRGGYMLEDDMDLTMWNGANLGAGLNLDFSGLNLKVDYAYRSTDLFDSVNVITASITL